MTQQTHPPVEFSAALAQFRQAANELLDVANAYPEALREKEGACGTWSPRQILAHECGWIAEAIRRFEVYNAGETSNVRYDIDSFNAESVATRADKDWDATLDELRQGIQSFISHAALVPNERASEDKRYARWLTIMAEDFGEHTEQLRRFAGTE